MPNSSIPFTIQRSHCSSASFAAGSSLPSYCKTSWMMSLVLIRWFLKSICLSDSLSGPVVRFWFEDMAVLLYSSSSSVTIAPLSLSGTPAKVAEFRLPTETQHFFLDFFLTRVAGPGMLIDRFCLLGICLVVGDDVKSG